MTHLGAVLRQEEETRGRYLVLNVFGPIPPVAWREVLPRAMVDFYQHIAGHVKLAPRIWILAPGQVRVALSDLDLRPVTRKRPTVAMLRQRAGEGPGPLERLCLEQDVMREAYTTFVEDLLPASLGGEHFFALATSVCRALVLAQARRHPPAETPLPRFVLQCIPTGKEEADAFPDDWWDTVLQPAPAHQDS